MRFLIWSVRILVFLLLLAFLSRNSGAVGVQFFFGSLWTLPLSLLMLMIFVGGALLGVMATASTMLRQRRELGRLRSQVEGAGSADESNSSASMRSV